VSGGCGPDVLDGGSFGVDGVQRARKTASSESFEDPAADFLRIPGRPDHDDAARLQNVANRFDGRGTTSAFVAHRAVNGWCIQSLVMGCA
jgi:hypothetical protein